MAQAAYQLCDKLEMDSELSDAELKELLLSLDAESRIYLYKKAQKKKEEVYGKPVFLRGLLEFSNHCIRNCSYCGLHSGNKEVERYRLSYEEMLQNVQMGYFLGYRSFVLQSGEDAQFELASLCHLVSTLKKQFSDIAITLSIGEHKRAVYQALRDAGTDRYLLRFECADEEMYKSFHKGSSLAQRLRCLEDLFACGFQTGSGFLQGLPGETTDTMVKNLRLAKNYQFHMVGVGPFLPHPQTPLAGQGGGSLERCLDLTAITRLLLPETLIPSTTALGSLDPLGREKGLRAGANVMMPNISPTEVRAKYELYPNKICIDDKAEHCRFCIQGRVEKAGYEIENSRGDHILFQEKGEDQLSPA